MSIRYYVQRIIEPAVQFSKLLNSLYHEQLQYTQIQYKIKSTELITYMIFSIQYKHDIFSSVMGWDKVPF